MTRVSFLFSLALYAPMASSQGLSRYLHPMSGSDLVSTERALVTPHLRVGALAGAEYLRSASAGETRVEHRITAFTVVTLGLFDRAQFGLSAPMLLSQSSSNLPSSAFGDLRLDARVRVAGPVRLSGTRVALASSLSLPTGSPSALSGDGSVGFSPRLILEWARPGGFVLCLNVGASLHGPRSLGRLSLGSEITVRAGLTLPASKRVWFTLEAFATTPFGSPTDPALLGLESLFGLHVWTAQGLVIALAAGPRVLSGLGTADLRGILLGGYAYDAPELSEGPGDGDRDGVLDPEDLCPTEPAGARPDPARRGCPRRDRDRDGVTDDRDLCPEDPEGDDPDPRRLGCPRGDQDRDGVGDASDVCPLIPAGDHPDGARRGCPDEDIDHDTVLNPRDACPEEFGVQSTDPRTNGCPRVRVSGDMILISQQPRFATDRAVILPESFELLSEVQSVLTAHPEITGIEVQGHTDDQGSDAHNTLLSERRARSITQWLVEHGIEESRVSSHGYGEARPAVDNGTARGRSMNRRVEFHITARR